MPRKKKAEKTVMYSMRLPISYAKALGSFARKRRISKAHAIRLLVSLGFREVEKIESKLGEE